MNVSKSPLRRATALVAGSLIGIAGAVAFASPALAHHNEVVGKSTCDKVAGEWVVDWTVKAVGDGTPGQTYKWTDVSLTPAGTTIDNPKIAKTEDGKSLPSGEALTGVQRVPGTEQSAKLALTAEWDNKRTATKDYTVTFEGECKKTPSDKPSASASASAPASSPAPSASSETPPLSIPEAVPAEPILDVTCDTMTIGVDNTNNDTKFTIDYKTSKGEERTLVVAPGKKGTETFSATEGFSVDVTFTVVYKGKTYTETGNIPFVAPTEGCDDGEGGGLPVTGAAAGGVAAGAAGLLAIGGALFFLARRRKVNFTA